MPVFPGCQAALCPRCSVSTLGSYLLPLLLRLSSQLPAFDLADFAFSLPCLSGLSVCVAADKGNMRAGRPARNVYFRST